MPAPDVDLIRSAADLDRSAASWGAVPWAREEAEREFLLARMQARGAGLVGAITRDGTAGVAALSSTRRFPAAVGYRTVYAPRVRVLQVVDGGIVAQDEAGASAVVAAVAEPLARGEVDVLTVPYLRLASPLTEALDRVGSALEREPSAVGLRRRLVVPATFDEFLASRSRKIRFGIRYDAKKLLDAHGDELSVSVYERPAELDRLVADLEEVAATTYHRALGGGFSDTPEQRAVAQVGLEHGWARAYVLRVGERPVAYWLCSLYRRTVLLRRTGFVPAFAPLRVGVYLLMRLIEDACGDERVDVVDFGQGDATYKRHFSSESWEERALTVFAPTLRGRRIALTRAGILRSAAGARKLLDRAQLTDKVRSTWRRRLRDSS